ncbi:unnamed protein product [Penicillium olsonii]|uniref:Fungal lipase-type domain-containing protein n=1 Tax=Penicillium olsonii TaxID=99116 RepID=A0A9W4HHX1_PENOL|nr:unnamed protein product [Penicillium olsonii]CAG8068736.1 unnamed protein product [Penicillium olsonii]
MGVIAFPVQLDRRAITSELLDNFKLYAQFAALAACDQNINGTRGALTCDQGPCDIVQADKTEIIESYHSDHSATGYIALDHTRKLIVVTFRGTISTWDGDRDKDFVFKKHLSEVCDNCYVHRGFWEYWKTAEEQVTSRLQQATKENPDYSITVAGHSLGGAAATLAGMDLRLKGFDLEIWTFGSPRVGNRKLAAFISGQKEPSVYRATHGKDIIPALPPVWFDYSQLSPEFWINQESGLKVTPDVVQYIEGYDNKTGNAGQRHTNLGESHSWYFGNLSICAAPADLPPKEKQPNLLDGMGLNET